MSERNMRKTVVGRVVSDKMDKTIVVAVERLWRPVLFLRIKDGDSSRLLRKLNKLF